MADRLVAHAVFLALEDALQQRPLPWPKLRYESYADKMCRISFPDLGEEETDVIIAELLMTR